jgi:hypothetical protein
VRQRTGKRQLRKAQEALLIGISELVSNAILVSKARSLLYHTAA